MQPCCSPGLRGSLFPRQGRRSPRTEPREREAWLGSAAGRMQEPSEMRLAGAGQCMKEAQAGPRRSFSSAFPSALCTGCFVLSVIPVLQNVRNLQTEERERERNRPLEWRSQWAPRPPSRCPLKRRRRCAAEATDRLLAAGAIRGDDTGNCLSSTAAAQPTYRRRKSAHAARQDQGCDKSCVWSAAGLSAKRRWHVLRTRAMP